MKKRACASALIAVIACSAAWTVAMVYRQRPTLPAAGLLHRTTVDPAIDRAGHARGIMQVDLLRQIIADRARSAAARSAIPDDRAGHRVPSRPHTLLGRPAPPFALGDSGGMTRDLRKQAADGPVVVVFYLGASCIACVSHLVELGVALPRFRERGATVWAVSADSPELTRERLRRFGDFRIPALSDPDHAVATAYGAWKPIAGGEKDDGEALHGTFLVDRDGTIRWAYLGDRPFADIDALLAELSALDASDQEVPPAAAISSR